MRTKTKRLYVYYYSGYIGSDWTEVSENHVIRSVLRVCPDLSAKFVAYVLRRDGDGHYFDFEVNDWVKYFKLKYYLKEVVKQ